MNHPRITNNVFTIILYNDGFFWGYHAESKTRFLYVFVFFRSPPPTNDADSEVNQTLHRKSVYFILLFLSLRPMAP